MRPRGAVGVLVAIVIGAILTYAASFTMSGINIHIVGVIIMLAGLVALASLLVRSVSGLRRREVPGRPPVVPSPSPSPWAGYRQDSAGRDVPPVAATCASPRSTPHPTQGPPNRGVTRSLRVGPGDRDGSGGASGRAGAVNRG